MRETHDERKSRSQKKRESSAAQDLGAALAALSIADLRAMDFPQPFLDAVADWKNFSGHEAKRRQMQYIGRLMREMDLEEIQNKLDARLAPSREDTAKLHKAEKLRDLLANADDGALEKELIVLADLYPGLPIAKVRHLSVAARTERAAKRPPKAGRELFRMLKSVL